MKRLVAISLMLIALPAMSVSAISPAAAAGQPSIQPVAVSGYTSAWEGTGWAAHAIVTFSCVATGPRLRARATSHGRWHV